MLNLKELILKMIKDSGWQVIPAGTASGYSKATLQTAYYKVRDGVCYLNLYGSTPSTKSTDWYNFGLLPTGARPDSLIYGSGACRNGGVCEFQIQANGQCFFKASKQLAPLSAQIVFVVGGVVRRLLNAVQSLLFREVVVC